MEDESGGIEESLRLSSEDDASDVGSRFSVTYGAPWPSALPTATLSRAVEASQYQFQVHKMALHIAHFF